MIPAIGATADVTKLFRLGAAAVRSALLGAKSVPEFLAIADAKKIVDASAGNVKVLLGTADDGKVVFEAQTAGWVKTYESSEVVTKISPDGIYSIGYRTKSTDSARGGLTKINGTMDVQKYKVYENGYREKISGSLIEIKFAE
jgi:hypothetical protein